MAVSRTTTFIAGGLTALVVGSGTAYAATGGNFILGKSNSAGATTVLSNPNGTALALNSKSGTPSLKVNRTARVPNLNADMVDGKHASAFALAGGRTGALDFEADAYDFTENGVTDALIAFATCPPGTRRTGGGGADYTASGVTIISAPSTHNDWIFAVAVDEASGDAASDVIGSVVCYNPRGGVPSSYRQAPRTIPEETLSEIERGVLAKLEARSAR